MRKETLRDELWDLSMDLHVIAARLEFLGKIPDLGCSDLKPVEIAVRRASADLSNSAANCHGQHRPTDPTPPPEGSPP